MNSTTSTPSAFNANPGAMPNFLLVDRRVSIPKSVDFPVL
jgi:hypothetical protein